MEKQQEFIYQAIEKNYYSDKLNLSEFIDVEVMKRAAHFLIYAYTKGTMMDEYESSLRKSMIQIAESLLWIQTIYRCSFFDGMEGFCNDNFICLFKQCSTKEKHAIVDLDERIREVIGNRIEQLEESGHGYGEEYEFLTHTID